MIKLGEENARHSHLLSLLIYGSHVSYTYILTEGNHASFPLHTTNNQVTCKSLMLSLHTKSPFPTQTWKEKLLV